MTKYKVTVRRIEHREQIFEVEAASKAAAEDAALYLPDAQGPVLYGSKAVPKVRVISDLSEKSLKGWTPGVNIIPTTTDI